MSIKVNQIDIDRIEERLQLDNSIEGLETWAYVKSLKEVAEKWQQIAYDYITKPVKVEISNNKAKLNSQIIE